MFEHIQDFLLNTCSKENSIEFIRGTVKRAHHWKGGCTASLALQSDAGVACAHLAPCIPSGGQTAQECRMVSLLGLPRAAANIQKVSLLRVVQRASLVIQQLLPMQGPGFNLWSVNQILYTASKSLHTTIKDPMCGN